MNLFILFLSEHVSFDGSGEVAPLLNFSTSKKLDMSYQTFIPILHRKKRSVSMFVGEFFFPRKSSLRQGYVVDTNRKPVESTCPSEGKSSSVKRVNGTPRIQ